MKKKENLYIKRRNQLFRDLSKFDLNPIRRQYYRIRQMILSEKFQQQKNLNK